MNGTTAQNIRGFEVSEMNLRGQGNLRTASAYEGVSIYNGKDENSFLSQVGWRVPRCRGSRYSGGCTWY